MFYKIVPSCQSAFGGISAAKIMIKLEKRRQSHLQGAASPTSMAPPVLPPWRRQSYLQGAAILPLVQSALSGRRSQDLVRRFKGYIASHTCSHDN